MKVRFRRKKLGDICNSRNELIAKFGADNAAKIMSRLFELHSVDNLGQIPTHKPSRLHQLHGDREGQYAVDLKHPFRLVFEPENNPLPYNTDGSLDLTGITEIIIIEVVDYHD